MTDTVKWSAWPVVTTSATTDIIPCIQGGINKTSTNAKMITLFNSNIQISESQVTNLATDLTARLTKADNLASVASASTSLSNLGGLALAGGTMTGNLILNGDPITALQAATKGYADSIASGLVPKASVLAATIGSNLNATYNNGTLGVGATLTNAGTQAAFSLDGQAGVLNGRYLIKDQSTQANNGIYTLTTIGDGSTNWVLTRATDYDQATEIPYALISVLNGTANSNTQWAETGVGPFTVGTTAITFTQFSAPGSYVAGNGISISTNTISAKLDGTNIIFSGSNISTAQGILTSSSPTFAGLTVSGLTASRLMTSNGSQALTSVSTLSNWIIAGTNVTVTDNGSGAVTIAAATGGITGFTQGSIVFIGPSGTPTQDNSNFFWDDTNHRLGIGTTTPALLLEAVGLSNGGQIVVSNYSGSSGSVGGVLYGRSARGTPSSPSAIQSGDFLTVVGGAGYSDSWSDSPIAGGFKIVANQNFTAANQGCQFSIFTTPQNSNISTEIAVFSAENIFLDIATSGPVASFYKNGDALIGTANLTPSSNAGFAFIPVVTGAPTGTPTLYAGGFSPMCYDTSQTLLYIYDYNLGHWRYLNTNS